MIAREKTLMEGKLAAARCEDTHHGSGAIAGTGLVFLILLGPAREKSLRPRRRRGRRGRGRERVCLEERGEVALSFAPSVPRACEDVLRGRIGG